MLTLEVGTMSVVTQEVGKKTRMFPVAIAS
jgi:hypothetical protein